MQFESISDLIKSRRTIFQFEPDPPSKAEISEILEFGIWAPNHRLTEPWRFTVIGEKTKKILADRYTEIQIEKVKEVATAEQQKSVGEKGHKKFMSKPLIIAVCCLRSDDDFQQKEDYAAVCCAIQNIQLAAWERGIGMQWSTGPITKERNTCDLLGLDFDAEEIVGFLYTGYPAEMPKARRKPIEEVLRWTN